MFQRKKDLIARIQQGATILTNKYQIELQNKKQKLGNGFVLVLEI